MEIYKNNTHRHIYRDLVHSWNRYLPELEEGEIVIKFDGFIDVKDHSNSYIISITTGKTGFIIDGDLHSNMEKIS